jgi:hypothetical protein
VPELLKGEMEKATMMIHTSTPPRPKPPRKVDTELNSANRIHQNRGLNPVSAPQ